jgi:hypothetical protein
MTAQPSLSSVGEVETEAHVKQSRIIVQVPSDHLDS